MYDWVVPRLGVRARGLRDREHVFEDRRLCDERSAIDFEDHLGRLEEYAPVLVPEFFVLSETYFFVRTIVGDAIVNPSAVLILIDVTAS